MFQRLSLCSLLYATFLAQAQPSLKTIPVPQPTNTNQYIRNRQALTILGKALFWDMQLGSDGRTACACCHSARSRSHCRMIRLTSAQ